MVKRRFLAIIMVILSLAFVIRIAYRDGVRRQEAVAEACLNKIWVTNNWTDGVYRDICFYFDRIADGECGGGHVEGILERRAADCLRSTARPFSGTFDGNTAECRFADRRGRTGSMTFRFVSENEIEADISFDGEKSTGIRTFRPYHIRDVDAFTPQEELTARVESAHWGAVYFVAGMEEGVGDRPRPRAFLVNESGDILYDFKLLFSESSAIYDAVFRDVNGDGLTDAVICTHYVDKDGAVKEELTHTGQLFLQSEDGAFELAETGYSKEKGLKLGKDRISESFFSVKGHVEREAGVKVPRRYYPEDAYAVDIFAGFVASRDITTAHVEINPENSVPEDLIRALSTALQNNAVEEYAAEISAEYVLLQENEIRHYLWKDTSGTLENFYYDYPGDREWFLFERDNDIIVRRKTENEEYPYYYYKFPCKGEVYGQGLPAYGKNGDYFFISWEDDDYLLVTKRKEGQVDGIAVYQMYGYALIGWILGLEKTPDGEIEVRFYTYSSDSGSGVIAEHYLDY